MGGTEFGGADVDICHPRNVRCLILKNYNNSGCQERRIYELSYFEKTTIPNALIFLFILILFTPVGFSENKSDSIDLGDIVKRIEEINMFQDSAVGYAGVRPEQYDNFISLKEIATVDELLSLTDHQNGVVRCYAFWALSYNESVNLYPIVLNHLNDTEIVTIQFGCIIFDQQVGDLFIDIVTPERVDLDNRKLNSIQLSELDSILIFGSYDLYAKSRAIERVDPEEYLYSRLRKLVLDENNRDALVSLARYQKKQDVKLILSSCMDAKSNKKDCVYTYRAIYHFPHPEFMPLLHSALVKALSEDYINNEWRDLYKAIAAYNSEEAAQLMMIPFTEVKHLKMRKYHINDIYCAVREHKLPVFHELFWKLWIDERRITLDVFEHLCGIDFDKMYKSVIEALWNLDKVYSANMSMNLYELGSIEDVTAAMLNMVLERDSSMAIRLIEHNIKVLNAHIFPIFSEKAGQIKNRIFADALFNRLETEENPHIYLKAAEALIAYEDEIIDRRILKARQLNTKLLEGWGSKAFSELLKRKGLE
jgi:hypothetical protein